MIEEGLVVGFSVTGDDCPLAEATAATDAAVRCRPPQYRPDDTTLLRFSASADCDRLAAVLDDDDRVDYLHVAKGDAGANFRCLSKRPCVVNELVRTGFLAESLTYDGGTGRFTGGVIGYDVLRELISVAGDSVGVDLDRVYPLESDAEEMIAEQWNLTPAQDDALRAALDAGYFDVPRAATAAEVGEDLGISKSAYLQRQRRGLRRLLTEVYREE